MKPTPEQSAALVKWYRSEWRMRTKAVKDGTARMDWVVAGYRIGRSELNAKAQELGINMYAPEFALWWDEVSKRAVR